MRASGTPDPQADVIAFLGSGDAFGGARPERIDTHAASLFLTGDRAWKLKRAVRFDYLDFSTAEQRRAALKAELRLNRRTAANLYLAVHPITRDANGRLAIDGSGDAIDWLLEMRRFPREGLLTHVAERGQLDERLLMRLADRIVTFHGAADVRSGGDGLARFRKIVDGIVVSMAAFPDMLDQEQARHVGSELLELTGTLAPLLDERARSGRVRHAHGDLHLANIALIDGEPTLFDCLEFSTELAATDLLYDLAFLLMDLWQRDLRGEANLVFNRYLDLSPADEDGIALMPLFLTARAAIRAHVLAAQAARAGADQALPRRAGAYLELATALLEPAPARLIAIGGLSGTGKSTLARAIGGDIGRAPGARILRSDVLRKRLAGVAPETRLSADHYSIETNRAVYRRIYEMAAAALGCGQAVIADAVFARGDERDAIEAVALRAGVPFNGLWLAAPGPTLLQRIGQRGPDASDADAAVALQQSRFATGDLGHWRTIAAGGSPASVATEARAMLRIGRGAA